MSEASLINGTLIRPWETFLDIGYFSLPPFSYDEAITRVSHNLWHFSANYNTILVFFTFITVLFNAETLGIWACVLLYVLIVLFRNCITRYPYPEELWCLVIDRPRLLIVPLISTVVFLVVWKGATWRFLCVLMVVGTLIRIHALCRRTEDLYLDEETARDGSISIAVVTDLERDGQTSTPR